MSRHACHGVYRRGSFSHHLQLVQISLVLILKKKTRVHLSINSIRNTIPWNQLYMKANTPWAHKANITINLIRGNVQNQPSRYTYWLYGPRRYVQVAREFVREWRELPTRKRPLLKGKPCRPPLTAVARKHTPQLTGRWPIYLRTLAVSGCLLVRRLPWCLVLSVYSGIRTYCVYRLAHCGLSSIWQVLLASFASHEHAIDQML